MNHLVWGTVWSLVSIALYLVMKLIINPSVTGWEHWPVWASAGAIIVIRLFIGPWRGNSFSAFNPPYISGAAPRDRLQMLAAPQRINLAALWFLREGSKPAAGSQSRASRSAQINLSGSQMINGKPGQQYQSHQFKLCQCVVITDS